MRACSVMSTLCDPLNCSLPGSSLHGISQARILECVVIPFSSGSSPSKYQTHISCVSCIGRQILYHWTMGEALGIKQIWKDNVFSLCNSIHYLVASMGTTYSHLLLSRKPCPPSAIRENDLELSSEERIFQTQGSNAGLLHAGRIQSNPTTQKKKMHHYPQ